jgi:predicted MFS family arabinose efflux permease
MWWGLVSIFLFMSGSVIESSWIADFWVNQDIGMTLGLAGLIISMFGVVAAVASFFVGALYEKLGPRLEMFIGAGAWLLAQVLFLAVALPIKSLPLIAVTYAIRGMGAPLFVYSFYTWVLYRSDPSKASTITGAFGFALTFGGSIVATTLAGIALPLVGGTALMWLGTVLVVLAAISGLTMIRYGATSRRGGGMKDAMAELGRAVSLSWRMPEAGLGGLIKLIQGCSAGFAVFYVTYLTTQIGFEVGNAVLLFTAMGVAVVLGNLVWGWLGNVIGWRRTVQYCASLLTAAGYLGMFYLPRVTGTQWLPLMPAAILVGLGLAAFLPINAIVTTLTESEKGPAVALLHVGLGAGGFVGPAIVGAVVGPLGFTGAIWTLVAVYLLPLVIMHFVRLPGDAKVAESHPPITADAAA